MIGEASWGVQFSLCILILLKLLEFSAPLGNYLYYLLRWSGPTEIRWKFQPFRFPVGNMMAGTQPCVPFIPLGRC